MIQDSGEITEFETGSVRDMHDGKGRCDLLRLTKVGYILDSQTLLDIALFMAIGGKGDLRGGAITDVSLRLRSGLRITLGSDDRGSMYERLYAGGANV